MKKWTVSFTTWKEQGEPSDYEFDVLALSSCEAVAIALPLLQLAADEQIHHFISVYGHVSSPREVKDDLG
jgi:hypothetical protein